MSVERRISLAEPTVGENQVTFSWGVTPASELYRQQHFTMTFPPSFPVEAVPQALWWRLALLCLHPHWPLLRPCRIELPVALPSGEREFWLRLCDAAAASLEARAPTPRGVGRQIAIDCIGPPVDPAPGGAPAKDDDARRPLVVSCFSGGRDSIVQAALLRELGYLPLLVTVTSPREGSREHETPRRQAVLAEMPRRTGMELLEVASDLRGAVRNDFGAAYGVGVSELGDTFLFLAAAIAVAAARGAGLVGLASEFDVQANQRRAGMVVQSRHFMYSAATLSALGELLGAYGITVGSLTSALEQFQLQRLLSHRYTALRDLQYSCWSMEASEPACSTCSECRAIALNLLAESVAPAEAGIDLMRFLRSLSGWKPGGRYLTGRGDETSLSATSVAAGRWHEAQELRALQAVSTDLADRLLEQDGHDPAARRHVLAVLGQRRAEAGALPLPPEAGYRDGYLEFADPRLQDGLRKIFAQHFAKEPPERYEKLLRGSRTLAQWVADPLRRAPEPSSARPAERSVRVRPAAPARVPDAELEKLGELVADPEPEVTPREDGSILRVAETLLDGNELRYVRDCLEKNWISSAGSYVTRFEDAFAAAVGSRHAVACSSGTAALHLALSAAGIGPRDEVILPAFTMIAAASAVRYVGATPVLVDVEEESLNLDMERLVAKLSPRTRAVIAVHTYGRPAPMAQLAQFAARHGLLLVEDAAEAHGATVAGWRVGGLGDVGAFSLYGNKILTSGEGGVVTTDDPQIAAVARELRDHAFSRERHFWHRRLGFNYRMTNLQAAVALAQVERLDELVARRRANAWRYRRALAGLPALALPSPVPGEVNWMFGVRVRDGFGLARDALRRWLASHGVETRTFFIPLHLQPTLREQFAGQRYPVAEAAGRSGLLLPSGPSLADEDIDYVADALVSAASPRREAAKPSSV